MFDQLDTAYLRGRSLTLYVLERGGEACGVTVHADWATWRALEAAADDGEPVTVRQVTYRRESSVVVFGPEPDEHDGEAEDPEEATD
jgi:hypothetical protein